MIKLLWLDYLALIIIAPQNAKLTNTGTCSYPFVKFGAFGKIEIIIDVAQMAKHDQG